MSALYFAVCIYILIINYTLIPSILKEVIIDAFNFKTCGMGILSTLIIGMQKGIFSSEVGLRHGGYSICNYKY